MQNSEIDNKIIAETTFELQNLNTLTELGIVQQEIMNTKASTETIIRTPFKKNDIEFVPRNEVPIINITNAINDIQDDVIFDRMSVFLKE
jgi:hypothetical protein